MDAAMYRDGQGPFSSYAQLVRIAESLRELIESYGLIKRRELDEAVEAIAAAWINAWAAVGEAVKIAAQLGRNVDDVNRARAAAGNLQTFARPVRTRSAYRVATGSTRPLRDAIIALRLALPEVVIPRPRPVHANEIDLRPRGHKTIGKIGAAVAFVLFVIAWVWVRGHVDQVVERAEQVQR